MTSKRSTLTAAQLIALLSPCAPDLPVVVTGDDGVVFDVRSVFISDQEEDHQGRAVVVISPYTPPRSAQVLWVAEK